MGAGEDRFSLLPDPLLLHILSLTESYRTAVVCSVLSKRWMTLYTQLPWLSMKSDDMLKDKPTSPRSFHLLKRFQDRVSSALLGHREDLNTLWLDTFVSSDTQNFFSADSVNDWLKYAAAHNVQHLSLNNMPSLINLHNMSSEVPKTPKHLFSCSSLVTLYLRGFYFLDFKCSLFLTRFSRLESCCMDTCEIHNLDLFIDNCPVLQTLELVDCNVEPTLTLASKSLLVLKIYGVTAGENEKFELKANCPNLWNIQIEGSFCVLQCKQFIVLRPLLSLLEHAQLSENKDLISVRLNLKNKVLLWLVTSMIPDWVAIVSKFSTLKTMELLLGGIYPSLVLKVVSSLPQLRSLNLTHCIFWKDKKDIQSKESRSLDEIHLKEANIKLSYPSPGDLQMISLLTQRCPLLHTLVVTLESTWIQYNDAGCTDMMKELLVNQPSGQHVNVTHFHKGRQIKITKKSRS